MFESDPSRVLHFAEIARNKEMSKLSKEMGETYKGNFPKFLFKNLMALFPSHDFSNFIHQYPWSNKRVKNDII